MSRNTQIRRTQAHPQINTQRFSTSLAPSLAATMLSVLLMASLGSLGNFFFRDSMRAILVRSLPSTSALNAGRCSGGIWRFGGFACLESKLAALSLGGLSVL